MAWLPKVPRGQTAFCGPVDPHVLPHPHALCDPLPESGTPPHHLHGTRVRSAVWCPSRAAKGHRMVPSEPRVLTPMGTPAPCPRLRSPRGFSWGCMNSGSVAQGTRSWTACTSRGRLRVYVPEGQGGSFLTVKPASPPVSIPSVDSATRRSSCQDRTQRMSPSTRMRLVRTVTPALRPLGAWASLPSLQQGV